MKFLSVRDLRGNSARVWRELPTEKEMVITSNGRPVAVLTAVNEANVEKSLAAWRQARALQIITEIQTESARKGTSVLSLDEINAEISSARKTRRKSSR
ncbi:type II toxin-antitoxin system prevent-host-death family antitoxin [Kamptonema cortianum]|uniref:Antitoxin n=1 Tax=Geitlerinema calcuttense NRMC-F 0142 TaxID=2922238 RepID=A0ABT7M208_9CYAN|nr:MULTISPECIES: type II toxin-antitoxin system prevent-host-death family antitoxin [Cyanophyceae]MDK3161831.1 type II toxin-antitoxin system prevent-host-death family antitoxin [Kamptonema cortianum]MDL5054402.1 type II toxin-antitoxin system prevent-host-death family antitoxin [Oscillatoria laete-virens NRMC-F 0139]MDL5057872.1 type II toxin-antitoxin system prevent-host-death family antitoxin [Geitlerinema calcuttense NRMC-F 0142]